MSQRPIKPGSDNQHVPKGPGLGDVAPHAVLLGKNVVPQAWTITMTSDTGDTFQFDVDRCSAGQVGFQSAAERTFYHPLAQNLANGPHTVEIIACGDGKVSVEGFYVYEPPLRP